MALIVSIAHCLPRSEARSSTITYTSIAAPVIRITHKTLMILSTRARRAPIRASCHAIDDAAGGMNELRLLLLGWNQKDRIISPALHR
jgi:hypothetical protein